MVDFGRKKWFWPILTIKTGFARFWPKNVILVDSGSFWVIWGCLMNFRIGNCILGLLWIFEVNYWFHRDSNPGPPARESDIMSLHYVHYDRFSEVKPGETHLLLGWATTWDKTGILRFLAPGGLVGQNAKCKKVAQFLDGFPPQKSA